MEHFFSQLTVLIIGLIILTVGNLITREQEQSLQSTLKRSLAQGVSLIICFGTEFILLARVLYSDL